jgi:hypothetical protein
MFAIFVRAIEDWSAYMFGPHDKNKDPLEEARDGIEALEWIRTWGLYHDRNGVGAGYVCELLFGIRKERMLRHLSDPRLSRKLVMQVRKARDMVDPL